ncbi:hypothetical protein SDC9_160628 [bioreactor metagenome]|uniref:Uncharacterized protein n=1 Tax=bioreactor metagenome TaxID=1076179 RepID=A0A645FG51_9ZZZZ
MRWHCRNDTHDLLPTVDFHFRSLQHTRIHAAARSNFQKAILCHSSYDHANLIHMCIQQDMAAPAVQMTNHTAKIVCPDSHIFTQFRHCRIRYSFFVSGCTGRLTKNVDHIHYILKIFHHNPHLSKLNYIILNYSNKYNKINNIVIFLAFIMPQIDFRYKKIYNIESFVKRKRVYVKSSLYQ